MLEELHPQFSVLAKGEPAESLEIAAVRARFSNVPDEYLTLAREATELELQHESGAYVRIWGPLGCVDMDEGYDISTRFPDAVPIGDNGGGKVLFYMNGKEGFGIYCTGYGDLSAEDAVRAADSLRTLLTNAQGATVIP